MRRAQAILVIAALLATPLALLARAASGDSDGCNRICCLSRGAHSAHSHHAVNSTMAEGSFCHRAGAHQNCGCSMKAGQQTVDYGFLAPIVPALLSAVFSVAVPRASLEGFVPRSFSPSTGFLSAPFEPPRV